MKPLRIITTIMIVAVLGTTFACEKRSGKWAAKIDGDTISIDELNSFYYAQNKALTNLETNKEIDEIAESPEYAQNPYLNKNLFLDHLISQKLLYKKAMSDPKIDKKEIRTLAEIAKMQTVAQYYLAKKLKDRVKITDEEVNGFYAKNKRRFAGRTADQATNIIKQQIMAYKSRQEATKYLQELIAQSKVNKDGLMQYLKEESKKETKKEKKEKKEK